MADIDRAPRMHTLDIGLACCAVEAATARALADALGAVGAPSEDDVDGSVLEIVVVAGTVTDAMAPLIRAEYDALRARVGDRLRVLSFGSCANTGGPYWDSYAVSKGIDQLLPVDGYVPGCPPRPDLLRAALAELR